jgi:uncharacterized protein (TIGR00369 family)
MTQRTRTIEWQDPMLTAAAAKGRTGLDFLRCIIAGEAPPAPIMITLGFSLTAVEKGYARFEGEAAEYHYNPMGTVHGGLACTLLDSALGCAVMTTCDEKTAYTTAQIAVHLTRGITAATGKLIAEALVLHRGRSIATADGKLTDAQGVLLAHATTTCLILPRSA